MTCYLSLKRVVDVLFAALGLVILSAPILGIGLAIRLTSKGPILYWSDRVGENNRIFSMPKFRTMRVGAPELATHLLEDACYWTTPIGRFLRKTSLDEIPQLISVMAGHMSLVGPRPALFNQEDLIAGRTACGVHALKPGITGWAQVNGRDQLSLARKVCLDREYLERRSLVFDLRILCRTVLKVARQDGVAERDISIRSLPRDSSGNPNIPITPPGGRRIRAAATQHATTAHRF